MPRQNQRGTFPDPKRAGPKLVPGAHTGIRRFIKCNVRLPPGREKHGSRMYPFSRAFRASLFLRPGCEGRLAFSSTFRA